MNVFLSDYIFSIASKSRVKIQNILAASQTSKENLDEIARRIQNTADRAPIVIRPESYGGLITESGFDGTSRDVDIRMRELFDESNLISLLLDTHTEILSSEVKRQRDQLDAFEKYVNNYSFMLADQGFFDHAYSESFSNDVQKETAPVLNTMLYDRSGFGFDPSLEILDIDQGAGILAMSSSFTTSYQLFASILKSNCASYITSDPGIDKSVSEKVGEGWRVAISSPRPIGSSLIDGYDKGAQFEIEYSLASPAPCDTFSIIPMSDNTIDILSIKIYNEDLSSFKELLSTRHSLKKNSVFYFDQDIVSKIVLVVNQPLYTRGKLPPAQSEKEYKEVLEAQRSEFKFSDPPSRENSRRAFHRLFNKWFLKSELKRAALQRPQARLEKYSPIDINSSEALSYQKEANRFFSTFKFADKRRNIFNRWMIEKIFQHQPELLERFTGEFKIYKKPNESIPFIMEDQKLDSTVDPMSYEYALGIRNVKLGITVNKNRGLFISKEVPSPVQSGEVRIQTSDQNYEYFNSYLDNPQVTTIEYSVTNKSNPTREEDWIPILSAFEKGKEIQERLFVQTSGYGALRFKAVSTAAINVYKNGKLVEDVTIVKSNDNLSVIGVRIPKSKFSLNTDDVYTVSYLPEGDPTTVNFKEKGFQQSNIASSYDDNGAGELFTQTGNSNTITVKNYPYVNFNKVEKESSYSSTLGLVGAYQPIKVVLSDGTIAYNYTNYTGIRQNVMDKTNPNITYLHSGKQIIFNKEIDQSFRVYYQYEPSYIRYRIIFRVNTSKKISPFVDSLTIKMKLNASILGMNNKRSDMQLSPSNKIYAQALEKLRTLTGRYSTVKTREVDQLAGEIATTLKEISEQVNGPTLKYDEIQFGDIPSSFRMNQFLKTLSNDINVILDEMNILKAASVHTHNFIKTEILKSELATERLHNKIKSLQLYSAGEDSSIIYAGDYFYNDEYIDWELVPQTSRIEIVRGDQISLGISSQVQLLNSDCEIIIEEGSNGFVGNNQELVDSGTTGSIASIFFKEEGVTTQIGERLRFLVDQQPNTSFQFEKYWVTDVDRNKALNFNFEYKITGSTYGKYLTALGDQEGNINWANNDSDLVLNFIVDLEEVRTMNLIKFIPFGLTDNKNAPILIKSVSISSNKSDWITLTPENVWVANGIDQNSISLQGENIVINSATFRVDAESVRYIRFKLLQPTSLPANIGHFYYNDPDENVEKEEDKQRFEGPIPSIDSIWREKDPSSSYGDNLVQRREKFIGRRWAIGIRDISAYSARYNETSYMISKRFYVPGGVDRVAIEADVELPSSFTRDSAWVRFFISPDDGNTWHQISRVQDDFLNIPEIIAYNDNTPVGLRLPGVKYVETSDTPKHLRVKIEMDRPTGDNTLTPIVKSYNLKIKQRVVQ